MGRGSNWVFVGHSSLVSTTHLRIKQGRILLYFQIGIYIHQYQRNKEFVLSFSKSNLKYVPQELCLERGFCCNSFSFSVLWRQSQPKLAQFMCWSKSELTDFDSAIFLRFSYWHHHILLPHHVLINKVPILREFKQTHLKFQGRMRFFGLTKKICTT